MKKEGTLKSSQIVGSVVKSLRVPRNLEQDQYWRAIGT